jgi:hypothetical protein
MDGLLLWPIIILSIVVKYSDNGDHISYVLRASIPRGTTLALPPGFTKARSLVSGWVFNRPPAVSQQRRATQLGGMWQAPAHPQQPPPIPWYNI